MANFITDISGYRNTILSKIINNDNIVRAVAINDPNFLDESHVVPDPYSLLYSQIYPYKRIPPTSEEQRTFITMSLNNWQFVNRKFVVGKIRFFVFTYTETLMQTDYSFLRTDYIASELHDLFNETNDLGVGKLAISKMDDLQVNDYFFGSILEYTNYEFN